MDGIFRKCQDAINELNRNMFETRRNINGYCYGNPDSRPRYDSGVQEIYAFSHHEYSRTRKVIKTFKRRKTSVKSNNIDHSTKCFNSYSQKDTNLRRNPNSSMKGRNKTNIVYNQEYICFNVDLKDDFIDPTLSEGAIDGRFNKNADAGEGNERTEETKGSTAKGNERTVETAKPHLEIGEKKMIRKATREKIRHLRSQLGPRYSVTGYPHFCKYVNSRAIPKSTLAICVRKVCTAKSCVENDLRKTASDEKVICEEQSSIVTDALEHQLIGDDVCLLSVNKFNIFRFRKMLNFQKSTSKRLLKTLDAFSECKHSEVLYIAFLEGKNITCDQDKNRMERNAFLLSSSPINKYTNNITGNGSTDMLSRSEYLKKQENFKQSEVDKDSDVVFGYKDVTSDKTMSGKVSKKLSSRIVANHPASLKSETKFESLHSEATARNRESLSDLTEIDSKYYTKCRNILTYTSPVSVSRRDYLKTNNKSNENSTSSLSNLEISEKLKGCGYEVVDEFESSNSSVDFSENNEHIYYSKPQKHNITKLIDRVEIANMLDFQPEEGSGIIAAMDRKYFDDIKRAVCENIGRKLPMHEGKNPPCLQSKSSINISENTPCKYLRPKHTRQDYPNSCGILKDAGAKKYKSVVTPSRDNPIKKISFAAASTLVKDQELEREMSSISYPISETGTQMDLRSDHSYKGIDKCISNSHLDTVIMKGLISTNNVSSQVLTSSTSSNKCVEMCSSDVCSQRPLNTDLCEKCTGTIDNRGTQVSRGCSSDCHSYSTDTDRSSKVSNCPRQLTAKVPKSYNRPSKVPCHIKPTAKQTSNLRSTMKPCIVKPACTLPSCDQSQCLPCDVPSDLKPSPKPFTVENPCQLPTCILPQSSASYSNSTTSNQYVQATASDTSLGLTSDTGESIEIIIPKLDLLLPNNKGGKISHIILLSGRNDNTSKCEVIKHLGKSSAVTKGQIKGTNSTAMIISPNIEQLSDEYLTTGADVLNPPCDNVNEALDTVEGYDSDCVDVNEYLTELQNDSSCIRKDNLVSILKDMVRKLKSKKCKTPDKDVDECSHRESVSDVGSEFCKCKNKETEASNRKKSRCEDINTTIENDKNNHTRTLVKSDSTHAIKTGICICESNKQKIEKEDKIESKKIIKLKGKHEKDEIDNAEELFYCECDSETSVKPLISEKPLKKRKNLRKTLKVCHKKPVAETSLEEASKLESESDSDAELKLISKCKSKDESKEKNRPKKKKIKKKSRCPLACQDRLRAKGTAENEGCTIQSFFRDLAGIMFEKGCGTEKQVNEGKDNNCSCEDNNEAEIVICELMPDDLECPNVSSDAVNVPSLMSKILKQTRAAGDSEIIARCKKFFCSTRRNAGENLTYYYPQCHSTRSVREAPPCETSVCCSGKVSDAIEVSDAIACTIVNPYSNSHCPEPDRSGQRFPWIFDNGGVSSSSMEEYQVSRGCCWGSTNERCAKHVSCRNLRVEAAAWPTAAVKGCRFAEAGVGCNLKYRQTSTQTARKQPFK